MSLQAKRNMSRYEWTWRKS